MFISNAKYYLKESISSTATTWTTFKISPDFERQINLETWTDSASIKLISWTQIERMTITATGWVATIVQRGLTQADTKIEDTTLNKPWNDWTIIVVTSLASDMLDIDRQDWSASISTPITFTWDNIFNWTSDFNAGVTIDNTLKIPTFADTTARDIAYSAPVTWNKCIISWVWEQYYEGWAWNTLWVWSPTPNASETVAGKVEIATNAEQWTHTSIWATWARLILANDQLVKTSSGASDENKVPILNASWLIDNFVSSASETTKWKIEIATSAEVIARIDTSRAIVPSWLTEALKDQIQTPASISFNSNIQATANWFVYWFGSIAGSASIWVTIYSDNTATPTTVIYVNIVNVSTWSVWFCVPIKKWNYYKIVPTGYTSSAAFFSALN